jgi:hypothetical protein
MTRRLLYNVYSNISDEDFFYIEDKLAKIESQIAKILRNKGWRITDTVRNIDGLAVNFIYKDDKFYGNICVLFEDKPCKKTFTFAVTKSFDEKKKRYFIRADIFSDKGFESFEDNIEDFVAQALKQYEDWSRYNIIYYGTVSSIA